MATIPPPPSVDPALPMETPSKAPSPLAFTDYRYYWFARFTAVMATIAMVVVIGYQLYDTARSDYGMSIREASFQLGLLGLVQFLPLAVLTPIAGWAADRFERRSVAIFSNLIAMGIAAMLGWFTWSEGLTLPVLRSEEHTSELQSLMRTSYPAVCLKKKQQANTSR